MQLAHRTEAEMSASRHSSRNSSQAAQEQLARVRAQNMELTRDAIAMNEEKLALTAVLAEQQQIVATLTAQKT